MKYKSNQSVVLCFRTYNFGYAQHAMDLSTALFLARDLKSVIPEIRVFAIDEVGRRIDNRPLTFTDLETQ